MFNNIDFNELKGVNCALVDVSSIATLNYYFKVLNMKVDSDKHYDYLCKMAQTDGGFQSALSVLERLIAYEFIVVDAAAVHLSKINFRAFANTRFSKLGLSELVRQTVIPREIYLNVSQQTMDSHTLLSSIDDNFSDILNEDFDGVFEKSFFDGLNEFCDAPIGNIANSGAYAHRVIFYMETAKRAEVPILLHPSKDKFLTALNSKPKNNALNYVTDKVDNVLVTKDIFPQCGVLIPPFELFVLKKAHENRTTLFDAVRIIRQSKESQAFREWLCKLQKTCFNIRSMADQLECMRNFSELHNALSAWGTSFDVKENVPFKRRKLSISLNFLSLLKVDMGGVCDLKDPIINKPLYLSFISSWLEH